MVVQSSGPVRDNYDRHASDCGNTSGSAAQLQPTSWDCSGITVQKLQHRVGGLSVLQQRRKASTSHLECWAIFPPRILDRSFGDSTQQLTPTSHPETMGTRPTTASMSVDAASYVTAGEHRCRDCGALTLRWALQTDNDRQLRHS